MMPTVEPRNRRVLSTRGASGRESQRSGKWERGAAFVFRAEAEGIGRNSQHWPVKRRNQPPWSLSTPPQRCRTLHTKSTGLSIQNALQHPKACPLSVVDNLFRQPKVTRVLTPAHIDIFDIMHPADDSATHSSAQSLVFETS